MVILRILTAAMSCTALSVRNLFPITLMYDFHTTLHCLIFSLIYIIL